MLLKVLLKRQSPAMNFFRVSHLYLRMELIFGSIYSGSVFGKWTRLGQILEIQEYGSDMPLLKIWCAVHRSALAWNSVSSSVVEVNQLTLASYFHNWCSYTRASQS